jgi:hypothetical protein
VFDDADGLAGGEARVGHELGLDANHRDVEPCGCLGMVVAQFSGYMQCTVERLKCGGQNSDGAKNESLDRKRSSLTAEIVVALREQDSHRQRLHRRLDPGSVKVVVTRGVDEQLDATLGLDVQGDTSDVVKNSLYGRQQISRRAVNSLL